MGGGAQEKRDPTSRVPDELLRGREWRRRGLRSQSKTREASSGGSVAAGPAGACVLVTSIPAAFVSAVLGVADSEATASCLGSPGVLPSASLLPPPHHTEEFCCPEALAVR